MGRERRRQGKRGALKTTLHRPIFTLTTHRSSKTNKMVYLLPTDLTEEHIPFSAGKCLRDLLFLIQTSQFPLYGLQHIPTLHSIHMFVCVNNLWAIPEDYTLGQLGRAGSTYSHSKPTISTRHSGLNKCLQKKDGRLEGTESMPSDHVAACLHQLSVWDSFEVKEWFLKLDDHDTEKAASC